MLSLVVMVSALAVILSEYPAHAQNSFYDSKVYSEYVNASLYCSNISYLPINDSDPVNWMLPNLTVLYHSTGKFVITDSNWTLSIVNATADDFGVYHCLIPLPGTSDYFLVKLGLNAGGPYFEDLWQKYMWNTIIGLSVAGGFALLCLFLYLIDHFRYRAPPEVVLEISETDTRQENGHVNDGYADGCTETASDDHHKSSSSSSSSYSPADMENGISKRNIGKNENNAMDKNWEHDTAL